MKIKIDGLEKKMGKVTKSPSKAMEW